MCLQTKKRFAKEWAEAEKATQHAEKIEHDLNATKLDVEKVKTAGFHRCAAANEAHPLHCLCSRALKAKHHAHNRMHTAEESRNDYAAQLQKYNKEQNYFYYTETPQIFNVRCLHTAARREGEAGARGGV